MDPTFAFRLLRDWGFLVHTDLPDGRNSSLLVAIRPTPTDRHYDPERVLYWVTKNRRGTHGEIHGGTDLPVHTPFAWGPIRVEDRFGISNEWVTCGGALEAAEIDGIKVCVFRSDAPILRRGGHSQGWDHAAANLAAWFGRIKVAVDYVPGFEQQAADASPRVFFAAFVSDLAARYRAAPLLRQVHADLWQLIRTEEARLRTCEAATWAAGEDLAVRAGLIEAPRVARSA